MRVVVAGAGPAGLACALGLHRLGTAVTVCDRDTDVVRRGAAIGLWWNGIDALRRLGLDGPLLAGHVVVRHAEYRNATGELLMAVPPEDFFPASPVPFAAVAREHLQRVLLGALAEAGAPPPRLGAGVVGLTGPAGLGDRGEVAVRLSDGTELAADLVVGADGLRSDVRRLAFPTSRVRDTGLAGWTGIAGLDRPGASFQHLAGTDGAVFFAPSRPGSVFWGTIARAAPGPPGPAGSAGSAREAALDRFGGWWPPVRELIAATPAPDVVGFRVHDLRPVRRWVRGRVVLVGDAAHAMVPHLAQGACQALEDAVALRDCLAAVGAGARGAAVDRVPAALAAYQACRERPGRRVAGASRLYARTLPVQDPLLRVLAGGGVRSRARRRVLSGVERLMAPGR